MTAPPDTKLMTAAELAELPDRPGVRYELRKGVLLCMSPSFSPPGVVSMNVGIEVGGFVKAHKLGICGTAESGFRLESDPDTVRAPDFWFMRAERIPADGIPRRVFWPDAPDLAVEVLSSSDRFNSVMQKAQDYLDAGTRLVWVIDPEARTAAIFRPDRRPQLIDETGTLDGEDVIPGFSVVLSEVLV